MNRLRGSACYLAGPMTDCPDLGVAWRDSLKPALQEMGVVVFDPCDKKIEIGREDCDHREKLNALRAEGRDEEYRQYMKTIRRVDLRCVDLSSFIIVRLDGTRTMGTYEELSHGVAEQKPVLIWLDGEFTKKNVNGWLLAQVPADHVFESRDDLLTYLHGIDKSFDHPTDRRWMLFDFANLYRGVINANR